MSSDHDDIDALISELNASGGVTRVGDGVIRVESLLSEVIARRGSDLFLVAGSAQQGPLTVEESLVRLIKGDTISVADAIGRAGHPDELESILRR